jgi:hypothetical protein
MERPWLAHYDEGVPPTLTYPNMPLFGLLEESARRFPNHPAIILADDSREIRRELMEFCRSRLASYKVPRRVRVVDALPKSAVGKVLRREVRDAEATRLGQET